MGGKRKLDQLELPEPIIQRIHSLLTEREAARTIILSKSWHRAWLTRPNIDLNDSSFNQRRRGDREFSKYAKRTLKRYERSNLKIESLKLCMKRNIDCSGGAGAALFKRLIVNALGKLGATCLSLRLDKTFVLPCEVVFGADNHLVELSVQGCTINADDGEVFKRGCCSKLKSLCLDGLTTTSDGLSYVISSCPSIENLSLSNINGLEGRYSYTVDDGRGMKPTVHLDVPSIRKFTFVGVLGTIPLLSFVSYPTREWESHVSIKRGGGLTISWFGALNEFLTGLRQSKIHLSLRVPVTKGFAYKAEDVESIIVCKHELESLTIDMTCLPSLSCQALFDGLFRLCRPKFIYLDQRKTTNLGLLCEVLEQGMLEKVSFPRQLMYGLNDLEEVNAQVFDTLNNDVPQWRPIPLSSLRDHEDSEDPDHRGHRFSLKWKLLKSLKCAFP